MLCLSFNIFLVCYLAVMILTCSLTICKHMNLNSLLLKLPTFENVPTSLRNCIDILHIFEKINKLIDWLYTFPHFSIDFNKTLFTQYFIGKNLVAGTFITKTCQLFRVGFLRKKWIKAFSSKLYKDIYFIKWLR